MKSDPTPNEIILYICEKEGVKTRKLTFVVRGVNICAKLGNAVMGVRREYKNDLIEKENKSTIRNTNIQVKAYPCTKTQVYTHTHTTYLWETTLPPKWALQTEPSDSPFLRLSPWATASPQQQPTPVATSCSLLQVGGSAQTPTPEDSSVFRENNYLLPVIH